MPANGRWDLIRHLKVKVFPEWLWLWLCWYEGWQAQSSAPVGQMIKRPAHCTSQVRTSSCAVTVNLMMSHFVPCNTKPFPTIHKPLHLPFSYIHVPISLKYHSHITFFLSSIHNLSRLASFKITSQWDIPSERSLHGFQGDKLVWFKSFHFSCNMQVSIIFYYLFVLEARSVSDQLIIWGVPSLESTAVQILVLLFIQLFIYLLSKKIC